MIQKLSITPEEITLLEEHYHTAGCCLIRERAHAVLLNNDGYQVPELSKILRRNEETVRNWLHRFKDRRIASLFHAYNGNNNAGKLTREQREEIKETLRRTPGEGGLPATFWTLPSFKAYVTAAFGVVYESDRSYHYLLEYCRYSWKLPTGRDRRRDNRLVERRIKEISSEVAPLYENPDWIIVACDETKITYETEIRRAWCSTGQKTIIKTNRHKIHQSYFGALNLGTKIHHLIPLDWQDNECIVHALEILVRSYPAKKICVLWDNAPWHKGKIMREKLSKGHSLENIHLVALPPYAPETNPEEHVWKCGKEIISNQSFATFDEAKSLFVRSLSSKYFDYALK